MRIIGNDPSTPRQAQVVASGTLPSGQPVVVNADGTVSVVSATGGGAAFGTPVVFNEAESIYESSAFDSNSNKVVISYRNSAISDKGYAVVGTVSGSSISFGTPVVFNNGGTNYTSTTFDSNSNKIVIAYQDSGNSSYGTAIVGTVSGTSISFGTEVVFNSGNTDFITSTFDSNSNKVVIAYRDQGNSQYGTAIVGTVSGTSISFGSEVVYNSSGTVYNGSTFDSNSNKVVIVYRDDGNSSRGTAIVGTVSGTSISFGSEVIFESDRADGNVATFDSNSNKVVVVYQDPNNSDAAQAIVGTVSGTSISFGSAVVIDTNAYIYFAASFDSNANKVLISYIDQGNSNYGTAVVGTVSGTSISFETPIVFSSSNSINAYPSSTFDSNSNAIVVSYRDGGNSDYGEAVVFQSQSTNLTANNYIGMSGGAIEVDSQAQEIGTPSVFESATSVDVASTFDSSNNKVIVAYRDNGNSDYGTVAVGTVSGTSISFGSQVVFNPAITYDNSAAFDSNANKVVVAYRDGGNSNYGTAIVGTVSGTSISFGSESVFNAVYSEHIAATFDSSSNKIVIVYQDSGNSDYGTAIVGTVSGTSISFGSPVVFQSANSKEMSVVFDSNSNKIIVAYKNDGNSQYGTAVVGTVSGTSISFGSPVVFQTSESQYISAAFDSDTNKVVIAFRASDQGTAIVGTVSGTSISFGSPAVFEDANSNTFSAAYDSNAKRVVIAYSDFANSGFGTLVVGAVSGTSISFDSPVVFESANSLETTATYDSSANKVVIAYRDVGNSSYGTSLVLQPAYENIIRGQVADGDTAAINLKGAVDENQSDLTAGQSYYVQTDGTLSTTAGDPSVFAGTAVAATKLIVKG